MKMIPVGRVYLTEATGEYWIQETGYPGSESAANFIVKACYNHDALVAALRDLYGAIDSSVVLTPAVLEKARKALALAGATQDIKL